MEQLVGQNCVRCGERIPSELDARFCKACASPVHDRCVCPSGEAGCPVCGAAVAMPSSPSVHDGAKPWAPQPSTGDAARLLATHVAERLQHGEALEKVRADLVARGMNPEVADQFLAAFAPGKWERGIRGWAIRGVGIVVLLIGGFLILGNQIGFFPTFPFAGTITVFLGAGIYVAGGGKG